MPGRACRSLGGVAVTATPRGRPCGWRSLAAMSRSQIAVARCSAAIDSSPDSHAPPTHRSAGAITWSHRSVSGTPAASRPKSCRA